jgi:hypothetical protein
LPSLPRHYLMAIFATMNWFNCIEGKLRQSVQSLAQGHMSME